MTKFKFIKFKTNKKIRVLFKNSESDIFVVFLHGLKSDLTGKKPDYLMRYCKRRKIGFLALEYSGHGKSYGKFESGTITSWSNDVKFIIKKKLIDKKMIIIGSSLGAWLGLIQFKYFKNIIGFIGIGSAPEFLERLIWKKLSKKNKSLVYKNKYYKLENDDYSYQISLKIIKDGRKNKVLNKKNKSKSPVYLLHGEKDDVVPQSLSKRILKIFPNSKKKFIKIKNGDHSLSRVKDLKILSSYIDKIID
tara:strand:- start:314 stop:1057 length:744 start_codon:yes stop_codon:yes gene_type:complete